MKRRKHFCENFEFISTFLYFCLITGFFQDGIGLEIHIFSTQFYICIDSIYIKEKFDIKNGHI